VKKLIIFVVLLSFLAVLFFGSTAVTPPVSAQEDEHGKKISSLLRLQVDTKLRSLEAAPAARGEVPVFQAMLQQAAPSAPRDRQQIFIHSAEMLSPSQIAELEEMGLIVYPESWLPPVGAHPTGFILADMPVDKLDELAAKDYIATLDTAERYFEAHNDLGTQKINADDVWSANYTGANVTIAVLDSGMDVTHPDIPTPTASKDYWNYPTLDDTIANTVTGHGTHVTGTALGRGTQSSGVYKGSAPGADLVFLKIGSDSTGSASSDAIVYAIRAAADTYNADIITMSYGGWSSYHDGSDEMAQAVDYAVSQGAVVFLSAGNEGNDDYHYSGTVNASNSTDYIQLNIAGAGTYTTALLFNLVWYDGTGTSNDLELEYYDSSYTKLSSTNYAQSESSRGTESEYSYYDNYVDSGDSTYYLKVKNNSSNSQFFHLYYNTAFNLYGSVTFDSPDPEYTIGTPAEADSAIAVGAYTTRRAWYDYDNYGWEYTDETDDQISTFSSRGPRVDTGAPNMPSVVSPGCGIISCRDDDVYTWPDSYDVYVIDNDGPNTDNATRNDGSGPADYYMMGGTSMACPMAAGVAALLLEKYPSATPAQIKQAFESTAVDKGDAGFDTTYGYGLIDALAALGCDLTLPTMETIAEAEGQYYNTAPVLSNFGFDDETALDDGWYQMDSYSGSWTVLFTDAASADISDLSVAGDNTTIYAVDRERGKIYKSTNSGTNWEELTNPSGATEPQLVAVASDNASIAAIVADGNAVYATTDGGTSWGSLGIPLESGGGAAATALYDIAISSGNGTPTVNYIAAAGIETGPLANIWYYDLGASPPVWKETNDLAGFGAASLNSTASAVAFSPNFWTDSVMVAITAVHDGNGGSDNVCSEIFCRDSLIWNEQGTFPDYPVTIVSDDGITGLDSASISMAPDYLGSDNSTRHVFAGLTVAGDSDAVATSDIYHLDDDNVTALKMGEQIHSVAYDGTNLVAGEYDSTDIWRSADPMAPAPTVNVTDASHRPGGENKVVVDWAGSKVVAGTSGNLSAFAVSTDNGTSFSDILVITDTSWDNDGWTIPGFSALANGSHTVYFKASDDNGNVEGESGEWSWQFNKGNAPRSSGGGGGGGGGGGAGLTAVRPYLDKESKIKEEVTAYSEDMKVEMCLPVGTRVRSATGTSISSIRIQVMAGPPLRPKDTATVGLVYEMGPAGATFDPPVDLTMEYDESKIPEGVAEKTLVAATYDDSTGQWINLESIVATENDTVTAKVSHFSAFTVLAYTRPASFSIADLTITPEEIELGEPLNISVLVTNDGNLAGSHEVSLKMDDLLVQTREVALAGGDSEAVSFIITPDTVGEHVIDVDGVKGTCQVAKPKAPAAFSASDLTISPAELLTGGRVTISVTVINNGDLSGTHGVSLKINGVLIETKGVTLDGGKSQKVVFTMGPDTAGTYSVDIDGLSGSFAVKELVPAPAEEEKTAMPAPAVAPAQEPGPAPEQAPMLPISGWTISGIIAAIAVVGLASYFFIRKRRESTRANKTD